MNNDVELEGRPRPLSTGLWTLFSWLRRDDRTDSSESLSSAGSDRTVASFAFLTPAHYPTATTPALLPPLGPPTDSYKKRVHDRNLRRQHDQGVTLHRKYGLLKSGDTSCGYDALSLPPVRRSIGESGSRRDRDRRATSECIQRRLAHVPGKRRAPLPPIHTVPSASLTSLTRRSTRKRRAPPPPVKVTEKNKENLKNPEVNTFVSQMNPNLYVDRQKLQNTDVSMGCKPEKYSKKEVCAKNTKLKSEKSFLKQIFDKKRNSSIDVSAVKLLPSISELDKQAAEIIENNKLNGTEYNNNLKNVLLENTARQSSSKTENWICVTCLRKYNTSIVNCAYCISNKKVDYPGQSNKKCTTSKASSNYTQTEINWPNSVSNNKNTLEEKQKLKEMLKEMKDSLPKRPKHDLNVNLKTKADFAHTTTESISAEMSTLRVGYDSQQTKSNSIFKTPQYPVPLSSRPSPKLTYSITASQVKPNHIENHIISMEKNDTKKSKETSNAITINEDAGVAKSGIKISDQIKSKDLHTPLRISSLLNPIYITKQNVTITPENPNCSFTESQPKSIGLTSNNINLVTKHSNTKKTSDIPLNIPTTSPTSRLPISNIKIKMKSVIENDLNASKEPVLSQNNNLPDLVKKDIVTKHKNSNVLTTIPVKDHSILNPTNNVDQHMKRRDLIHQLEQSIAKGDEGAAAEAASKLAQLRLSCSVLSFSSQILSQPSASSSTSNSETSADKVRPNASKEQLRKEHLQLSTSKQSTPSYKILVNNVTLHTQNTGSPRINDPATSKEMPIKKSTAETKNDAPTTNQSMITIAVLVEDREATRGPVHLRINRQALMKDLRREAETTLGLPINLQRWIVGRVLCVNDHAPVISLAGPDFSAPFYLCVVESEKNAEQATQTKQISKDDKNTLHKAGDVYTELIQLEQQALVHNAENFECGVCMEKYPPGRGVVLRECVHIFCKNCLSDVVRHCGEANVPCPDTACRGMLQEREIRALVTPQDYERWLARGLAAAESGTRNAFHCRTKDCKGWALCEPGVQKFPCPVCKHINCIMCQDIHDGVTCEVHQIKLKQASASTDGNLNDDGTRTLLNALIAKGEALECPECSAIITKKWGCDWVKCSACKTEICWVTRGRRWGPGGKGDTSGGCRCGVDGKRCHPSCGYCH